MTTVKIPHLVMALLYLATAATWLLLVTGLLQAVDLAYVAPGVLVAAGLLGLLAMGLGARRRNRATVETEHPDDLERTAPLEPTRPIQEDQR